MNKNRLRKNSKRNYKRFFNNFQFELDLPFPKSKRLITAWGYSLIALSIIIFFSLLSYFFTGKSDQSIVESLNWNNLFSSSIEIKNWLGLLGAVVSYFFVYQTFGIGTFLIIPLLFFWGFEKAFKKSLVDLKRLLKISTFIIIWSGILMGYLVVILEIPIYLSFLCGNFGFIMAIWFNNLLGLGTLIMLILLFAVFLLYTIDYDKFKLLKDSLKNYFSKKFFHIIKMKRK